MIQIIFGSVLLSLIHALIPNHWLPIVAVARSEGWRRFEALFITAIVGLAHTLSTAIIGIIVGLAGYRLSGYFSSFIKVTAPSILVLLGMVYLFSGRRHAHYNYSGKASEGGGRRKSSIVMALAAAMFFAPCIEIEAFYFSAGVYGWMGIGVLTVLYLLITVSGMVLLVDIGLKGAKRLKSHFLEHHEKKMTGATLVILGVAAFFVDF